MRIRFATLEDLPPPSPPRTGLPALEAILAEPGQRLLVAPRVGLEMTVIDSHTDLIQYYQRRGYHPTGDRQPYPVPLDPPYEMLVLAKALAA